MNDADKIEHGEPEPQRPWHEHGLCDWQPSGFRTLIDSRAYGDIYIRSLTFYFSFPFFVYECVCVCVYIFFFPDYVASLLLS